MASANLPSSTQPKVKLSKTFTFGPSLDGLLPTRDSVGFDDIFDEDRPNHPSDFGSLINLPTFRSAPPSRKTSWEPNYTRDSQSPTGTLRPEHDILSSLGPHLSHHQVQPIQPVLGLAVRAHAKHTRLNSHLVNDNRGSAWFLYEVCLIYSRTMNATINALLFCFIFYLCSLIGPYYSN